MSILYASGRDLDQVALNMARSAGYPDSEADSYRELLADLVQAYQSVSVKPLIEIYPGTLRLCETEAAQRTASDWIR